MMTDAEQEGGPGTGDRDRPRWRKERGFEEGRPTGRGAFTDVTLRGPALPARIDPRRAVEAYRRGRHRSSLSPEEKRAGLAEGEAPAVEGIAATGAAPRRGRVGVGVPERLAFHRGASIWRDRLPEPRERPREKDAT